MSSERFGALPQFGANGMSVSDNRERYGEEIITGIKVIFFLLLSLVLTNVTLWSLHLSATALIHYSVFSI